MIKAHKATNQARFLLRRKLTVEGFGEGESGTISSMNSTIIPASILLNANPTTGCRSPSMEPIGPPTGCSS